MTKYLVFTEEQFEAGIAELATLSFHGGFLARREIGDPVAVLDALPALSSSPVGGRGLDVEQARPGTVPGSAADLNGHLASLIADGDLRVRVVLAVDAWLERCDARAAADREEPTS